MSFVARARGFHEPPATGGDLFLAVGTVYDQDQISGWHTRLMHDEVIAEWLGAPKGPALHAHCHVSGGFVLGSASTGSGLRIGEQLIQDDRPIVEYRRRRQELLDEVASG